MESDLDANLSRPSATPATPDLGLRGHWADFFDLAPEDVRALKQTRRERERVADRLFDTFYARFLAVSGVADVFRDDPERLARLRQLHQAHFVSLDDGAFDVAPLLAAFGGPDASVPDRSLHRYLGPCSLYLALAVALLAETMRDNADLVPTVRALVKVVMLDLARAMEAYVTDAFVSRQTATDLARAIAAANDALRKEQDVARSRDEFVNLLVHDLRNPVQGIALQANVTLQIAIKSLEAERDHLSQIERTCHDLSRLLQDMLEAAQLEAGEMPVAPQPVALMELLDDVLNQHLVLIERAGIRLTRALTPDVPIIRADPALLRRVLMNLIVNAVRHSGSDELRIEGAAEGRTAAVRIIDYGRGIPVADQERIFQKYTIGTPPAPGTGLGLYFCRLATERMQARLELNSRPGLTVFELRLPAA